MTIDLDELERLLAAATGSGIWAKRQVMDGAFRVRTEAGSFVATVTYEQDAALIVTLRNSAPAMIAELRELRAENARLKEALEPACEVIESCNATFLHKWGTTNKWRNGVLAAARATLGEPQ